MIWANSIAENFFLNRLPVGDADGQSPTDAVHLELVVAPCSGDLWVSVIRNISLVWLTITGVKLFLN
jgi:hypothetical protein